MGDLRIDQPGIYELSTADYHADPCVIPSFSRTIAKWMLQASPAHAAEVHPRLGGGPLEIGDGDDEAEAEEKPAAKEARDIGTAAHALFLRGESVIEMVPFDSYRSKVAKAARDEILAAGKVPVKQARYDDVMRMVEKMEAWRARTGLYTHGKAEQTVIWTEHGIWCRAMIDWLPDDPAEYLRDLKTTSGLATSAQWTRAAFATGTALQSAFYPRGVAEVRDGEMPAGMRFDVWETKPPYGHKTFELGINGMQVAEEQIAWAMAMWRQCQMENAWPSYSDEPEMIEPPVYVMREWDWQQRVRPPPRQALDTNQARQVRRDILIADGTDAG